MKMSNSQAFSIDEVDFHIIGGLHLNWDDDEICIIVKCHINHLDTDFSYHYETNIDFDPFEHPRYQTKAVTRSHLLSFMTDYLDKMAQAYIPEKVNVV